MRKTQVLKDFPSRGMYLHYFYWQFVMAPTWLLRLILTIERALVIFFSVPTMITTLFAHWHRDRVSTRRGALSGIAIALAWNLISRVIGFLIRSAMLLAWAVVSSLVGLGGIIMLFVLYVLPLVILLGIATGIALLYSV